MMGIITKTNEKLKSLLTQKGQGLVEFALVLAFCAAIVWAARETGFSEAISALLGSGEKPEYVTAAIGGGQPGTGGGDNSIPSLIPITPVAIPLILITPVAIPSLILITPVAIPLVEILLVAAPEVVQAGDGMMSGDLMIRLHITRKKTPRQIALRRISMRW